MRPFVYPSEIKMVRFLPNICPVSRAAAAEMGKRLVAIEADMANYKMLALGTAGLVGTAVLVAWVTWARAGNTHKRTIAALTSKEQDNRSKIEVRTPPTQALPHRGHTTGEVSKKGVCHLL